MGVVKVGASITMQNNKQKAVKTEYEQATVSAKLDVLDNWMGKIDGHNYDLAYKIFSQFDAINQQIIAESGIQKTPAAYQVQWDYLQEKLRKDAVLILRALGGVDAFKKLRDEKKHPESAWWWYLDDYLSRQQRKNIKKTGIIFASVMAVLVAIVAAYQFFLAPPPEVRERIRHEFAASRHMENGEFPAALQELDLALALDAQNYQNWTQKGVINLKLGDKTAAEQAFVQAEATAESLEFYYLERAQDELFLRMNEAGLQDAQNAIKANPNSARAYLLVGQAHEQMGKTKEAYAAYESASFLAETQDDVELMATVRVRMGMLMQSFSLSSPQP